MTTIQEARKVLGKKKVFGPDEWGVIFGDKVNFTADQLAKVTEIPWNKDVLKKPGIPQPHFLFLGIQQLGGKKLDLEEWLEFYKGARQPFNQACYGIIRSQNSNLLGRVCDFGWYLMPEGMIHGTGGKERIRDHAQLPDGYSMPFAIELVTANILFHLLNGSYWYLDMLGWLKVRDERVLYIDGEKEDTRLPVYMSTIGGILVAENVIGDNPPEYRRASQLVGLSASRKLP